MAGWMVGRWILWRWSGPGLDELLGGGFGDLGRVDTNSMVQANKGRCTGHVAFLSLVRCGRLQGNVLVSPSRGLCVFVVCLLFPPSSSPFFWQEQLTERLNE
jgi:hypothetical protein